jgi:uncharacterized protein with HEPN domain
MDYKRKKIAEVRNDLIDRKMDEDWSLLWEDVEINVDKLQNDLRYFDLNLDCISVPEE